MEQENIFEGAIKALLKSATAKVFLVILNVFWFFGFACLAHVCSQQVFIYFNPPVLKFCLTFDFESDEEKGVAVTKSLK